MNYALNAKPFLDMIAASELGRDLMAVSDDGYNVIVGSTAIKPRLFISYADHPREKVFIENLNLTSTAAGRYQILAHYFDVYKIQLGLNDFAYDAQDQIAWQMIRECHAAPLIISGHVAQAITLCASRWRSFPGVVDGQHKNKMDALVKIYHDAGGRVVS